jgi:hypothetical protein
MGSHAKPRTRVRSVALGTLAVGATLTGVGLTAAALDPADATLADGTIGTDPVDFAASGLGAPVPVIGVNVPDGSSEGSSTVNGSAGTKGGVNGNTSYTTQRMALPADVGARQLKQARTTVAAASTTQGSTSSGSTSTGYAAQGERSAPTPSSAGAAAAGTTPLVLPSLDTSLPINTALPVPSLTTVSGLPTTVSQTKSTVRGMLDELARLL